MSAWVSDGKCFTLQKDIWMSCFCARFLLRPLIRQSALGYILTYQNVSRDVKWGGRKCQNLAKFSYLLKYFFNRAVQQKNVQRCKRIWFHFILISSVSVPFFASNSWWAAHIHSVCCTHLVISGATPAHLLTPSRPPCYLLIRDILRPIDIFFHFFCRTPVRFWEHWHPYFKKS